MPVTASELAARVTAVETLSTTVSPVPLSLPAPVHPLIVKVLPPPLESVRFAVLMPVNERDIGPAVSELAVSVKPDGFDAARVDDVPVSEPFPVQPVSVKVCPLLVMERLAVAIPLRLSDMPSAEDNDELPSATLPLLLAVTVPVPTGAVSKPLPVQPLTVNVLLEALAPESVATLMPVRLSVKVAEPVPVKLPVANV